MNLKILLKNIRDSVDRVDAAPVHGTRNDRQKGSMKIVSK
jgi:hypothetical protein